MSLDDIKAVLAGAKHVAILPHVSADGDSIGSCLSFAFAMEKMGARAKIYMEEEIPLIYRFLPGRHLIEVYPDEPAEKGWGLVVALDTGDTGRLGRRLEIFQKAAKTVNIDHHNTNTGFADINFVDSSSSAVGEIIYKLLKIMDIDITPDIASCLYVAISTDTGGFRFSNTTPLTHHITADLMEKGADVADLSRKIFDTTSLGKVKLIGFAAQNLELLDGGKIALITVSDRMIRESGALEEDCDGIVNLGRNVRGVEVAVMLRENEDGEIKANLRSNTDIDVSAVAKALSGGGHKKAAGFTAKGGIEEVKSELLELLRKAMGK